MPGQRGFKRGQAGAVLGGRLDHRVVQIAVNIGDVVQGVAALRIDQVRLVQHQGGGDPGQLRRHQVAVEQGGGGRWHGREHHQQPVHVGGHRLQVAVVIRPLEHALAGLDGGDHAVAVAFHPRRLPDHPVAHHQLLQIGAEVAARRNAGLVFHQHLAAEVGHHGTQLFLAQGGGHRVFLAGPALGPLAPFRLDFLDPPLLAPVQFAFRHKSLGGRTAVSWGCRLQDTGARPDPLSCNLHRIDHSGAP